MKERIIRLGKVRHTSGDNDKNSEENDKNMMMVRFTVRMARMMMMIVMMIRILMF